MLLSALIYNDLNCIPLRKRAAPGCFRGLLYRQKSGRKRERKGMRKERSTHCAELQSKVRE